VLHYLWHATPKSCRLVRRSFDITLALQLVRSEVGAVDRATRGSAAFRCFTLETSEGLSSALRQSAAIPEPRPTKLSGILSAHSPIRRVAESPCRPFAIRVSRSNCSPFPLLWRLRCRQDYPQAPNIRSAAPPFFWPLPGTCPGKASPEILVRWSRPPEKNL
jgi:hypothetical protein